MNVVNIHEREISTPLNNVAVLLDSLSSSSDKLWPNETWPAMIFDKPLQTGATGGHGPIGYTVKSYEPGKRIFFEFTAPPGLHGHHWFELEKGDSGKTIIRHVIEMRTTGITVISWPLVFSPLHNALVEDAFDKVERNSGLTPKGSKWNLWVKFLRWLLKKIIPK